MKFRATIKLNDSNWVDWSDIAIGTLKERGLWLIASGKETAPVEVNPADAGFTNYLVNLELWEDKDVAARNQLLENMEPEIRSRIRAAPKSESSHGVWSEHLKENESQDPDRIAAVVTQYDNVRLTPNGNIITEYIDVLVQLKQRLDKMGYPIADAVFAARLLRLNRLPSSWEASVKAIRANTKSSEEVITKLKAEQAAMEADQEEAKIDLEKASQAKALSARASNSAPGKRSNGERSSNPPTTNKSICDTCKRNTHATEKCYFGANRHNSPWIRRQREIDERAKSSSAPSGPTPAASPAP